MSQNMAKKQTERKLIWGRKMTQRAGRKRKKGRSRRRIKERPAGQKLQKAAFPNCRRCL